ncbi:MAG: nucleoside transporter C-terminal domain-containing protein [Flavobacteriales bacterium]|jgi:CNT family concentrative nucleoside transporter|nr:Na+ dependent nucleoside transporter [Flavobacteriales bacterium]|tara:strand:+ start:5063 stop:6736 length:1674 start_codon:yes stop_codon:yes gene_type:complete
MKKILSIIFLIFLSISSYSNNLTQKWWFSEINSNDENINLEKSFFSNSDYFILNSDSSFSYQITEKKLYAKGTWALDNDLLSLYYSEPKDTVRFYKINQTSNQLILSEGNKDYIFSNTLAKATNKKSLANNYLRGILGLLSLVFLAFLFSKNKKEINWSLVSKGILIQLVLAFLILKVPFVQNIFEWMSQVFVIILQFSKNGALFLFGDTLVNSNNFGAIFAFQILPTIVFFSALTSLLFYFGILQKIIFLFAYIMKKTLKLSGAESLAAAGNIFLGQTESPLLVKPYIDKMTKSELLCLMSGGMATIAGGVLAAYIGFLGGTDPVQQLFFAKHLLAASVMSAPAAIVVSKILLPETNSVNEDMSISSEKLGSNSLEAISIGTSQGVRLAINVGAMLLVFIAFITMANYFLKDFIGELMNINNWITDFTSGQYNGLTLEFILGYLLAPLTWLMGVCKEDMILVGQLLGEKTILNEFVAYISLSELKETGKFFEEKSIIIATYILCGFANFASIGIQIGGIGSLAPSRRKDLSQLGILALIAGTLASLLTAVIVGAII